MPSLIATLSGDTNNKNEMTLKVLEIAAGVGVHTIHFASQMISDLEKDGHTDENKKKIKVMWYPTDPDVSSRFSIGVKAQEEDQSNTSLKECLHLPALPLTLGSNGIIEEQKSAIDYSSILQDGTMNLITCINMIHISPWEATIGLFQVASQKLTEGGMLYCYGPFKENGTAVQSNLNFDVSLKARDSAWGVRDLESVVTLASQNGLSLQEKIEMPANNLSLIFRKGQ